MPEEFKQKLLKKQAENFDVFCTFRQSKNQLEINLMMSLMEHKNFEFSSLIFFVLT